MSTDEEQNEIAEAIASVGRAIDRLGNADAATPMGGLEALGAVMKEGCDHIAGAIDRLAEAVEALAESRK